MSQTAIRVRCYDDRSYVLPSYWKDVDIWYLNFPHSDLLANLANHKVEEHDDGTISVTPSIKVWNGREQERHGYLTKGVWNEC